MLSVVYLLFNVSKPRRKSIRKDFTDKPATSPVALSPCVLFGVETQIRLSHESDRSYMQEDILELMMTSKTEDHRKFIPQKQSEGECDVVTRRERRRCRKQMRP